MGHFGQQVQTRQDTPSEWLSVGAAVGDLTNKWAYREDIVANLSEVTSAAEVPALFSPARAEVEVSIPAFKGKTPDEVGNLRKRINQLDNPVVCGAIFHEACHARFSRYSLPDAANFLGAKAYTALMLLEEGRIEAWGVRTNPENKCLLYACAMNLVFSDIEASVASIDSIAGAAKLAGLALARVDAGVLEEEDVAKVREALEEILGADLIDRLQSVWTRFQAHSDHYNATELYKLAQEWVELVEEKQEEAGETKGSGLGDHEDVSDEEGSGEDAQGSGELSETAKKILEALQEASDNADIGSQEQLNEEKTAESWKEQAEEQEKVSEERSKNKSVAKKVFNSGAGSQKGAEESGSNSRLVHARPASAEERISAVTLSKLLAKAKYRDRKKTKHNNSIPGGKLRTRALVQGEALKARGVNQQVDAWRHTKRKQVEQPELKVGVMVDISGSMSAAMQPMATTAWVLSEGVRRIQGKVGMVYYGQDVFATLKPGQHLKEVQVYNAPDSTEQFGKAFQAIDGAMDLVNGQGARLLVIVSDGYYMHEERRKAHEMLSKAVRNGVAVLWIQIQGGYNTTDYTRGVGINYVELSPNAQPTEWANLIGKTAANALTKVGSRQA